VALTSGLTVEDVEAWPDVLASVTIDEVMDEARRLFTDTSSVTGYLMQPAAARGRGRKPPRGPAEEVSQ
jgi:zinc protease